MWLLDARTMRLAKIVDEEKFHGKYAILSHTWEKEDDEVNFDDIHQSYATSMKGYKKIEYTCIQAVRDGFQYVWVDTCCIDKKSSAELSEAINSMYRWYYYAAVCYAYLSDVRYSDEAVPEGDCITDNDQRACIRIGLHLQQSRWFSRGWTLQELLAPKSIEFYDVTWTPMSTKAKLVTHLSIITKIPTYVLKDRDQIARTSIAQRMSWAAGRSTSRVEDQAYALLGIFGISIPLVYGGEGSEAFMRLQEMIIQTSPREDHSLLVWPGEMGRLLAPSPRAFVNGDHIVSRAHCLDETFELSNKGLRVTLLARPDTDNDCQSVGHSSRDNERYAETITVALNCQYDHDAHGQLIALRLRRRPRVHTIGLHKKQYNVLGDVTYDRLAEMTTVSPEELRQFTAMTLTIARKPYAWPDIARKVSISDDNAVAHALQFAPCYAESENVLQDVGGLFNLQILDSSIAFGKLIIKSPQGNWADVILAVGMDYNETPPKLLVHALEYSQNETMSRSAIFGLCHVIREGEQRLLGGAGAHSLLVAARFVLVGGELMWNLEIGRPGLPPAMDFARNATEKQPGHDQLASGSYIAVSTDPVSGIQQGSTYDGTQESYRSTPPVVGRPSRLAPAKLPLLDTNLPSTFGSPELETRSPIPASSIDAEQYWKQQRFLAELYLAHVHKPDQTLQQDLIQDERRSRPNLRPSSTLRKTRLVRFMHSKMQKLFQADSAIRSGERISIDRSALEELLGANQQSAAELASTCRSTTELPADSMSQELPGNCQAAELPTFSFTRAAGPIEVEGIYELDATPIGRFDTTPTSSADIPEIDSTEVFEADVQHAPTTLRRRFSWEEESTRASPPLYELSAQEIPLLTHGQVLATTHSSLLADLHASSNPFGLESEMMPQLVSAR